MSRDTREPYYPVEVQLTCGHLGNFYPAPRKNDELYCRKCQDWTTATRNIPAVSWKAKCTYHRCTVSRTYGANEDGAYATARKHVRDHPDHRVEVTRNGEHKGWVSTEQEPLPDCDLTNSPAMKG